VDGFQSRANHLYGLCAGEGAEGTDRLVVAVGELGPEPFRAVTRERVLDLERPAQAQHVFRGVIAPDSLPPWSAPRLREGAGLASDAVLRMLRVLAVRACGHVDLRSGLRAASSEPPAHSA